MTARIIRIAVIAVALLLATLLVPDIEIEWADDSVGSGLTLLALALAFGLVNAFIRPIARLVSLPLNLATLGLFSVLLNAVLLLGMAFLVDLLWGPLIVIGGYPPDLSIEAVTAAALGSVIISVVSTGLLAFLLSWDEFFYALVMTQTNAAKTVPVALNDFIGRHGIDFGMLAAGGVIAAIPPVIIAFAFQRHLVAGLTAGGVKG